MADSQVTDSQFVTAMNVFGFPIPDELGDTNREVVLFTKTANGKAIGQPLSFTHPIMKNPKETKCHITEVLADSLEDWSAEEIIVDNVYYVKKQSKANLVFFIVNNSGMEQVFVEYPERMKNGHKSSVPIRLAVDWHFRGEFLIFRRLEDCKILISPKIRFVHLFNGLPRPAEKFYKMLSS